MLKIVKFYIIDLVNKKGIMKMNMKTINKIVSWFLYIGLPLVVVGLFIWQLDNLENSLKKYPNAMTGLH